MPRRLTVAIDTGAAERNLSTVRDHAGASGVIAVVKADAYGHGAAEMSKAFIKAGASALAVAYAAEARPLRAAGITASIIMLFEPDNADAIFTMGLTPVLHDLKSAEALSRDASRRGVTLGVHVKADTGMGRMGLADPEDVMRIAGLPALKLTGLMSHFSEADSTDDSFTMEQTARFRALRDALAARGLRPTCHIANSAAALYHAEARFDAIRPGISLYGVPPSEGRGPALKPVMSFSTRIAALRRIPKGRPISYGRTFVTERDTLAAVLAAGYADGYSRALSNQADVLIRGRRARVLGRVCMDLTVVDATAIAGIAEGDTAVLLGADGADSITAWELARMAGTIPYEVLLNIGRGAERTYH